MRTRDDDDDDEARRRRKRARDETRANDCDAHVTGAVRSRTVETQMRNERWATTFVRWVRVVADNDDDESGSEDEDDDDDDDGNAHRGIDARAATTSADRTRQTNTNAKRARRRVDRRRAAALRSVVSDVAVQTFKTDAAFVDVRQMVDACSSEISRVAQALEDALRCADAYGQRANSLDAKANEIITELHKTQARQRDVVTCLNGNLKTWATNFDTLRDEVHRLRDEAKNFDTLRDEVHRLRDEAKAEREANGRANRRSHERVNSLEELFKDRCDAMDVRLKTLAKLTADGMGELYKDRCDAMDVRLKTLMKEKGEVLMKNVSAAANMQVEREKRSRFLEAIERSCGV